MLSLLAWCSVKSIKQIPPFNVCDRALLNLWCYILLFYVKKYSKTQKSLFIHTFRFAPYMYNLRLRYTRHKSKKLSLLQFASGSKCLLQGSRLITAASCRCNQSVTGKPIYKTKEANGKRKKRIMSQNIQITQIFVILWIKLIRYSSCDVGRSVTVSGYTPSQHPMTIPHCFELHN